TISHPSASQDQTMQSPVLLQVTISQPLLQSIGLSSAARLIDGVASRKKSSPNAAQAVLIPFIVAPCVVFCAPEIGAKKMLAAVPATGHTIGTATVTSCSRRRSPS